MGSDRYVILTALGNDPWGTTYLAREAESETRVVYKELAKSLAADAAFVKTLRENVETMSGFAHPNCVRVLEVVTVHREIAVVSEFVKGTSLRSALTQGAKGALTPTQALGTMRGILLGLGHAHRRGVLHRDIRPENVVLDADGTPRLGAFGQNRPVLGRTVRDIPRRCAAYMSPERLRGEAVDDRTDIYSCGALLYRMITGQEPFDGDSPAEILKAHAKDPTPDARAWIPTLPRRVADLIKLTMAPERRERPQSVADLLRLLEAATISGYSVRWESQAGTRGLVEAASAKISDALTLGADVPPEPPTPEWPVIKPARRPRQWKRNGLIGGGGVAGVLLVSGLVWSIGLLTPAAKTTDTPTAPPSPSAPGGGTAAGGGAGGGSGGGGGGGGSGVGGTPTAAPTEVKTTAPDPVIVGTVSITSAEVWFAPCYDNGSNCAPPERGSGFTEARPFDASAYRAMRLMDSFSWTHDGSPQAALTVDWTASGFPGASRPYPLVTFNRLLQGLTGKELPTIDSSDLVVPATRPGVNAASFTVGYIDDSGRQLVRSPTFFWSQ